MKKTVIFKALAILGVGTTAYLTAKAVPFFVDYYEEWTASRNFSDTDDEKLEADITFFKQTVRAFTPAVLSGVATIGSICLLDKEHIRIQDAIIASLCLAKEGFDLKDRQIPKCKKDEILVYEPYTDQIFATTDRLIEKAVMKIHKRLNNYYFETLNRFIKDLGGAPCPFGDRLGWSCENPAQMEYWKKTSPMVNVVLEPQQVGDFIIYELKYDVNPLWIEGQR